MKHTFFYFSCLLLLSICSVPSTSLHAKNVEAVKQNTTVHHIESADDYKNLTTKADNEKKLLVIDVKATWCGPCKAMAPIFEKVAKELNEKALFAIIDADIANSDTALSKIVDKTLGVRGYPTFVIYRDGKKIDSIVGKRTEKEFENEIVAFIEKK